MLKKTITYIDYNGAERTEDHYFNLSKAEVTEMELSVKGGYTEMINAIIAAKDNPAIMKLFKEFIWKAYGKKSPDGRRFEKSDEISKEFMETEAYSTLLMELMTNAGAAAEFVNAILPKLDEKALNNVSSIPAPVNQN